MLMRALVGLALIGCVSCGNQLACWPHSDLESCSADKRCFPKFRCDTDGRSTKRCSDRCTASMNRTCWIADPNTPDSCIVDFRGGHFNGCIATDGDPTRCRRVADKDGLPNCEDTHPPCSGCALHFDTCGAKGVCHGIVCF
jgi:hypothetical protein